MSVGLVLVLPAAAHADRPVCQGADLDTLPGTSALNLPAPTCTTHCRRSRASRSATRRTGRSTENPNVYRPDPGFHGLDEFTFTSHRPDQRHVGPRRRSTIIVDTAPTCRLQQRDRAGERVHRRCLLAVHRMPTTIRSDIFVGDLPAHGSIAVIGGQAIYTPAPGYSGPDSFTFYARGRVRTRRRTRR